MNLRRAIKSICRGHPPAPHGRLAARLRFGCLALILTTRIAAGAPAVERPLPARLDESVDRGLAYLSKQQHADGSFDDEDDGPRYRLASTGLALLAFLASGHTPDTGRYGVAVRGATDLLVDSVPADGYAGVLDESGMYGQAIVALALAEVSGVETAADKRRTEIAGVAKLVQVILKAQEVRKSDAMTGGWGATPRADDSNLTLTALNAIALRAANAVGVVVPKKSLADASEFITRCYRADERAFAAQPDGEPSIDATGAGALCIALLERPGRREVRGGVGYLVQAWTNDRREASYADLLVTTLAAWQSADDAWVTLSKITLNHLIQSQSPDGGWPKEPAGSEPGRRYRTAVALLALSVPYRLLPAYQQ